MIGKSNGSLYSINMEIDSSKCNNTESKNTSETEQLWHRRYAHLSLRNVSLLKQKQLVAGLENISINNTDEKLCEPCVLGKMTRQPFNHKGYRAKRPLELVHSDVCGPVSPTTWDNKNYFVTFIDDYTHFVMVYLIKHKSEVFEQFKNYYNYATKHFNCNLLKLRTDNGREYVSKEFEEFCKEKGIVMQYTVAYNPEMNGTAERMNRTLVDKARTLLIDSKMSKRFWGEAIFVSAYTTNRSPTSSKDKTPSELWEGRKPNVSNMRVFGSIAYNHVPKELRKKLDPKGKRLIMMGYCSSGYKLWDEEKQKMIAARNVIFNENPDEKDERIEISTLNDEEEENDQESENNQENIEEESQKNMEETIKENNRQRDREASDENDNNNTTNVREKRKTTRPVWHKDYVTNLRDDDEVLFALQANQMDEDIPQSYEDIETKEEKQKWMKAVEEEIKVLTENQTWEIISKPKDAKLLDTKWVFTKKKIGNETIHKARLVARGFQQQGNFDDIYSPVLKLQTLRILLSIASHRNYHIHQMDVRGAFLYGRIDEQVYLTPPKGLKVKPGKVLKLTRSLYGLKKSPRYWYEHFNRTIVEYGFKRSENDSCLFIKKDLYLLVYVDDLLIMGNDLQEIVSVKKFLSERFKMKDMGSDNILYLGIAINKVGNKITIDQTEYLEKVLKKFGMAECNSTETPMDANFHYDDNKIDLAYEQNCRSLIGSLMYATVGSRPDLAASVYYLSRFQSKPNENLWKSLKRILRYVKGTIHYKLEYDKNEDSIPLVGYADADWARDQSRKSTSGYVFKIYDNTVIWRSTKQASITLSTTEAEFVALSEAAIEACWIRKLLEELEISVKPITIYEDNQSTIKATKNYDQKRLKHMDIKYNFIKQKVEDKVINIEYINTQKQLADIFTKPLNKTLFKNHEK